MVLNSWLADRFIIRIPVLNNCTSEINFEKFVSFFESPIVKEAIYLASPSLFFELEKLAKGLIASKKEREKLLLTFSKYYLRMQTRCTPYGLFAGCAVGQFGAENIVKIEIENLNNFRRKTRPDMNYLCSFSQELSKNKSIQFDLNYQPNNSIYKVGDQLRYVEYNYVNGKRNHQLTSVTYSEYLDIILKRAKTGATILDLCQVLESEGIGKEEAIEFINEIINSQLLISPLEPKLTGEDVITQLEKYLEKLEIKNTNYFIQKVLSFIQELKKRLQVLDLNKINNTNKYRELFQMMNEFSTNISETNLFQVDLFFEPIRCELNNNVREDIVAGVKILNSLIRRTKNENLEKFKDRFNQLFENREMPLLNLLDTETGIGYISKDTYGSSELLDDMLIPVKDSRETLFKWNPMYDYLFKKYLNAIEFTKNEIELSLEEIVEIDDSTNALPYTMPIMFRLIDRSGLIHLQNCGGTSSAANLLGRFAYADTNVNDIISEVVKYEENLEKDKVIAEIVHLPDSRTGNILLRPVFRKYEIPFLTESSLPTNMQISLSDIMVSVINDRIVLRSQSLNKEILPRMSTAHNYVFNTMPVYQFLCELQNQDFEKRNINFDWGPIIEFGNYFPRVRFKNIILSPATWKVDKIEIKPEFIHDQMQFNTWRKNRNIPDKVYISEMDNELAIDFNTNTGCEIFFDYVKKKEQIIITEFLFTDNTLVTDRSNNPFTHECIAVLYNQSIDKIQGLKTDIDFVNKANARRTFLPGDEWIYYKIYCGIKTADKILCDKLKDTILDLFEKSLIDQWFFIRYNDPEWHIRLRVHLIDRDKSSVVIDIFNRLLASLIEDGLINNVEIDTYHRELERYQSNNILNSEELFYIDSKYTLEFLSMLESEKGDNYKLYYAIKVIDDLLEMFNYNLNEKYNLMAVIKTGFIKEHSESKELKHELDKKFRNLKHIVIKAMDKQNELEPDYVVINKLIFLRNNDIKKTVNAIIQSVKPLNMNIVSGYIHMMMNRIFNCRQRTHEMLVYDLIYRYYRSKLAIQVQKSTIVN